MSHGARQQSLFALIIASVLTICLAFAGRLFAQSVTGSIYGTVTDTSGAIIPTSKVTATNVDTGEMHSAISNASGQYVFAVLSPGDYTVSSSVAGFETARQNGVRVAANQNVNVIFAMKVGAVSTTVDIQAGTTLVDTRESTIGMTIDQRRIQDLPLVDRNAYDLVTLVPGVTNYSASAPIGDFDGTQFSTNGLPANFNSFYLDGSYNASYFRGGGNIVPNPDALAEFSILTSNQDAEFGRYPGAVVNTITRSGSNQFHGVAYDFLRNTALNAKNYFASNVTHLVYNIFGAGVGGPVKRDKLFFYLNYQGTRINTPSIITSASIIVPSALERVGNFSQSTKKPTKTGCATGQVPVAPATICIDPVAAAGLKYVPAAVTSSNHPAQQEAPANTDANQGIARIDYQLNAAHKLQFMFFQSRGNSLYPTAGGDQIFGYAGAVQYGGQSNYVLGDTWVISPRAVNSVRLSYSLNRTIARPNPSPTLVDLGSTIPQGSSQGLSVSPHWAVKGYFTMGGNNQDNTNQSQLQYAINDTLNYSRGHHTAKFGGEVIESRYSETAVAQGSTVVTFTGSYSGNALADFMEGHTNAFSQNSGPHNRSHALDPSVFAQDDWHISRRVTLDLGMRWEVFYPFKGQRNLGTFIPGEQSQRFPTAPLGLLSVGDPGVPDGDFHVSYKRFAPRIGFAADLLGNGRLSLKGAYGIFYSVGQETFSAALQQEPFTLSLTLNNTSSLVDPYNGIAPYNGVSPFPIKLNEANPIFVAGASLGSLRPDESSTPYVQEYNLALQQQWGTNWSSQIAYVGNASRRFFYPIDRNAPMYAPGATTSNASIQARRPYQPEADISLLIPGDNGSYNSLQLSLTRRFAHRFSLMASYVWSKSFNFVDVAPSAGGAYELANEFDPQMDYGLSTNDVPQRFVASYLYALPGVRRFGILGKEVLSGWQINGITSLQTGGPFNIVSNTDTNFDGIATDRPNVTGSPLLGSGRSRAAKIAEFFNTAAYSLPPAGELYGNSRRNSIIAPGNVDTDISAFKRFALYGHSDLLFRGEIFNVFNNVNLANPGGTFGTATFGTISGAGQPRIVQFALKLEF